MRSLVPDFNFKVCFSVALFITDIKSKSAQTEPNSINYTELHVSTYLRSSSCSQFVFKMYEYFKHKILKYINILNTNCEPEDDLK
jgi:hypothetical protein